MIEEFNNFNELIELLDAILPDGTKEEAVIDNMKVSVSRDKGNIKMSIVEDKPKFNDELVKKIVTEFKNKIQDIDDDTFVEIAEEIKSKINVKEFDSLLNLKKYSEKDAIKVSKLITEASVIIQNHLQKEITRLVNLYEKF